MAFAEELQDKQTRKKRHVGSRCVMCYVNFNAGYARTLVADSSCKRHALCNFKLDLILPFSTASPDISRNFSNATLSLRKVNIKFELKASYFIAFKFLNRKKGGKLAYG